MLPKVTTKMNCRALGTYHHTEYDNAYKLHSERVPQHHAGFLNGGMGGGVERNYSLLPSGDGVPPPLCQHPVWKKMRCYVVLLHPALP